MNVPTIQQLIRLIGIQSICIAILFALKKWFYSNRHPRAPRALSPVPEQLMYRDAGSGGGCGGGPSEIFVYSFQLPLLFSPQSNFAVIHPCALLSRCLVVDMFEQWMEWSMHGF